MAQEAEKLTAVPFLPRSGGYAEPADAAALEQAIDTLVLRWTQVSSSVEPQVSAPQLRVLLLLEQAGELSMGVLGDQLAALPSSVSRLCDRLAAAGWVVRHMGADDRREVLVRLTNEGCDLLGRIHAMRRSYVTQVVAAMGPQGRDALARGLAEFRSATR